MDDGNDLVVAGPGDETILGGVAGNDTITSLSLGQFTDKMSPGQTWSASSADGEVTLSDNLEIIGVWNRVVPANYEGNYDSFGEPVNSTNDTVFGGSGNDLIVLSNGDRPPVRLSAM
jgi:Ca2+-binding RTX toxin-like protein